MSPTDPPIEKLLGNRGWLQRLARQLLADPSLADDVVQSTLLAGIQNPPSRQGAVRGWLATVLRNEVRARHRGEQRRVRREREVSQPEEAESERDLLEQLETQKLVTEAVVALTEPYRHTVLLRYFEGLEPQEIGRRLGVSSSTVRSRLMRAHEELRRRLDGNFGDRSAWRRALFPLCLAQHGAGASLAGGAGAGAGLGTGALIAMKKVVVGGLVVSLLVGALWWRSASNQTQEERSSELTTASSSSQGSRRAASGDPPLGASPDVTPSDELGPMETEADEASPLEAGKTEEESAESAPQIAVVSGHIYCEDGRSFEGARVFLWGYGEPGSVVDRDGMFHIESLHEHGVSIFLEYEGHRIALDAEVRPVFDDEIALEIEVEPGHEIELELVSDRTGDPVPGAKVTIRRGRAGQQANAIFSRSDDHGKFYGALMPAGPYTAEIEHPDHPYVTERFEVPAREPIVFRLPEARPLRISIGGYDRYPEPDRLLVQMYNRPERGRTPENVMLEGVPDEDGVLTLTAPRPGNWVVELFGTANYPRAKGMLEVSEGEGPIELALQLPGGDVVVRGTVLGADGTPVGPGEVRWTGVTRMKFGADGSFETQNASPGTFEAWCEFRTEHRQAGRRTYSVSAVIPASVSDWDLDLRLPGDCTLSAAVEGLPEEWRAGDFFAVLEPIETGSSQSFSASGTGGAEHRVTWKHLSPGKYRLKPHLITLGESPREMEPQEIELVAGSPLEVSVLFEGVARLRIELRVPDGVTLPERVSLWPRDAQRSQRASVQGGVAVFEWLRPFSGSFDLVADGFAGQAIAIDLELEEDERIVVELEPTR